MAELNNNRNFKGVWIPKEIWNNKELTWMEKLLLVEMDSLDNENGCFAGNEYFANFFDLSQDRISKLVTSLRKKEYITVELQRKGLDKTKRIVKVDQFKFKGLDSNRQKQREPLGENAEWSLGENAEYNNTSINNTNNIKDISKSSNDKSPKPKRVFSDDSYEMLMVNLFISEMQKNSTLFKEPSNKQQWCNHVRLIIDIDLKEKDVDRNKRFTILKELVLHSCNKPYYYKNIRSIDKLRKRLGEVSDDLQETKTKQNKKPYNNYNTQQNQTATQYQPVNIDSIFGGN